MPTAKKNFNQAAVKAVNKKNAGQVSYLPVLLRALSGHNVWH